MDESTRGLYQNRLNEKLGREDFPDTIELYDYIKNNIKKAAEEALGIQNYDRRKDHLWWDRECEETIQQKKKAYMKWRNTKT